MTSDRTSKPRAPATSGARAIETSIGTLRQADLAAVVRLDARLTGRRKPAYWKSVFSDFVTPGGSSTRVGLAARSGNRLSGYLLGEVRAFEFGSPPCGWIFSVGVDPDLAHHGIGSALVTEAGRRFARAGVSTVRTMVARANVSVLSFFRSNGFTGGSFTQLEMRLDASEKGS
jgi:ribosomal protein S18 acetylase RimI-like enzyme